MTEPVFPEDSWVEVRYPVPSTTCRAGRPEPVTGLSPPGR
jgi:hypothetical protein